MSDQIKQWHYSVNNQSFGPFGSEQMRALLASGTVNGDTLVWASPMQEWLPLSRTELAAPQRAVPPQASGGAFHQAGQAQAPGGVAQISVGGMNIAIPAAVQQAAPPEFLQAVQTCLAKYADFSGRAARPEFWWFYLFGLIVMIAAIIIDWIISSVIGFSIFQLLVSLALIAPQLAVGARRLHDTDRSGWMMLVGFIPILGLILLIYWFCQPGTQGQNRYG